MKNSDQIKLFFNYSIDCETPANTEYTGGSERMPFFHGPVDWNFAEAAVRGFIERMVELGAIKGASLFVYPDVARHQKQLFREMAQAGIETALHLNGLRYSRLTGSKAKWLGLMAFSEQRDALRMAKDELEQTIGQRCFGYRACYGSANDDTFPICEELGFEWASNSSGRHRPDYASCWWGSWPYGHRASRKSRLIPGDLKLYEIPVSRGMTICFDGNPHQPFDLRVETAPSILGEDRRVVRDIIAENLEEMERRGQPVRAIIGASHNTSPYGDQVTYQSQNLGWIARHAHEQAKKRHWSFIPASFAEMTAEARRVDSF